MKKHWLDDPKNVTKIVRLLFAVCVLLLAAGFFIEMHGHFSWENWPGFFAIFGFVTFAGAVLAGKQLRKIVMRKEDYYDR